MAAAVMDPSYGSSTRSKVRGMTPKQRSFAEHLLSDPDFNLTRAAEKAGYKNPVQDGWKLWKLEPIRKLVGTLLRMRSEENRIDANRVLVELARLGFFNPKGMLDADGGILDLKDMPDEVAVAVKKYKKTSSTIILEDGTTQEVEAKIEVEFWDKLHALELLAKHVGILKDLPPNMVNINIDWSAMSSAPQATQVDDPVERQIAEASRVPQITQVVDHASGDQGGNGQG